MAGRYRKEVANKRINYSFMSLRQMTDSTELTQALQDSIEFASKSNNASPESKEKKGSSWLSTTFESDSHKFIVRISASVSLLCTQAKNPSNLGNRPGRQKIHAALRRPNTRPDHRFNQNSPRPAQSHHCAAETEEAR